MIFIVLFSSLAWIASLVLIAWIAMSFINVHTWILTVYSRFFRVIIALKTQSENRDIHVVTTS